MYIVLLYFVAIYAFYLEDIVFSLGFSFINQGPSYGEIPKLEGILPR